MSGKHEGRHVHSLAALRILSKYVLCFLLANRLMMSNNWAIRRSKVSVFLELLVHRGESDRRHTDTYLYLL